MKVAFISEENKGLDSVVSRRFGRDPYLIIVDLNESKVKDFKIVQNPGSTAAGGAAIKTVQKFIDMDVDMVVAGGFGPNALTALEGVGIKYKELSGVPVREALKNLF